MSNQENESKVAVKTALVSAGRWRWLKVGLPALALSGAFATTALAHGGGPGGGWGGGKDGAPTQEQREKFMEKRVSRMLEHVNATPQQETQIKAILANHKAQIQAIHQEGKQLHDSMRALMTAPTVDAAGIEAVRSKMVAQHDKSSRVFAEVALQVGQVLTQAQRQQLAEHMAHGGGHGRGPGGPFGF